MPCKAIAAHSTSLLRSRLPALDCDITLLSSPARPLDPAHLALPYINHLERTATSSRNISAELCPVMSYVGRAQGEGHIIALLGKLG